jgi:hypothetical protein
MTIDIILTLINKLKMFFKDPKDQMTQVCVYNLIMLIVVT